MLLLNDHLDIDSIRIVLQRNEEVEGIGSGQVIRAEITDPLWRVEINTPINEFNNGRRIRAILNDIDRPQSYFRVTDPIAQFAANDPNGELTGITIASRVGNRVRFDGQPVLYQWVPGDAFHILYGGRHYYFEIAEAGDGLVRTTPTVPSFIPPGTPCEFVKPEIRVQMVDLQMGSAESSTWKMSGFQIRAIQKL